MTYTDFKNMADLISAFLLTPLPVYLVEDYVKTKNPIPICAHIKSEMREDVEFYPIDIVEKIVGIYE